MSSPNLWAEPRILTLRSLTTNDKPNSTNRTLHKAGCIPCLKARRPCNTHPDCKLPLIREQLVNTGSTPGVIHGTWRERRGLHVFFLGLTYVSSNAGLFRSDFWNRSVPEACLQCEPLYHLGAALGMLLERKARLELLFPRTVLSTTVEFHPALRQVNKALQLLSSSTSALYHEMMLLSCILLVSFEALIGDRDVAIQHGIQAPALFTELSNQVMSGQTRCRFIRLENARPVVKGLELQAKYVIHGSNAIGNYSVSTLLETGLPQFQYLRDLRHAHATLQKTYLSLLAVGETFNERIDGLDLERIVQERKTIFGGWMSHWMTCYKAMLEEQKSSISARDLKKCSLLEVCYNHMHILAHLDLTHDSPWDEHLESFQRMMELAPAVLDTYDINIPTGLQGRFPFIGHGLTVSVALLFVMSRCSDHDLQEEAAKLLLPRRQRRESNGLAGADGLGKSPTSETIESWIRFLKCVSLELGAAAFFCAFRNEELQAIQSQYPCPDIF